MMSLRGLRMLACASAALMLCHAGPAECAGIQVSGTALVSAVGTEYAWTYSATLDPGGQILYNPDPALFDCFPGVKCNGLVTIYDFDGYVAGTEFAPNGDWVFLGGSLVGVTPAGLAPTDDPTIVNLSWAYRGQTPISNNTGGSMSIGGFGAHSLFESVTALPWATEGADAAGGFRIRVANVGTTQAPTRSTVPEPSTLLLAGVAIVSQLVRKRSRLTSGH